MSRLAGFSGRDVEKVALQLGWIFKRQSGSHRVYVRPGSQFNLSVPDSRELSVGLLHSLINKMGISVEQFLERHNR